MSTSHLHTQILVVLIVAALALRFFYQRAVPQRRVRLLVEAVFCFVIVSHTAIHSYVTQTPLSLGDTAVIIVGTIGVFHCLWKRHLLASQSATQPDLGRL